MMIKRVGNKLYLKIFTVLAFSFLDAGNKKNLNGFSPSKSLSDIQWRNSNWA